MNDETHTTYRNTLIESVYPLPTYPLPRKDLSLILPSGTYNGPNAFIARIGTAIICQARSSTSDRHGSKGDL
jgi:hypothetical protein